MLNYVHVLEDIEYDILTGVFRPRERLVEKDIVTRFRINRNTVRKILKELEIKKLITHFPNRGAIVSELSEKEVRDTYALRILLEGYASNLIIKNITCREFNQIKKIFDAFHRAAKEKDFKKMVKANIEFHYRIIETCGNNVLTEMIEHLRMRSHLVLHSHWRQHGAIRKSMEEHGKILQALKTRSVLKLKRIMEKHIKASLKSYLGYLKGFS